MKIAQIAPPWFAVPPTGYGGIELVVAILADGLAERGHDVTLFASGGSRTKAKLVSPLARPARSGAARQRLVRHLSRDRVVPPDHRRVRRRPRPQRDHRAGDGRAARRPSARGAHAARPVDRAVPPLLRAARRAPAHRRHQRGAARRQPRHPVRRRRAQRHRPRRLPVPRRQGRLPRLHRARQPRQGPDARDRGRAACRACRSRW